MQMFEKALVGAGAMAVLTLEMVMAGILGGAWIHAGCAVGLVVVVGIVRLTRRKKLVERAPSMRELICSIPKRHCGHSLRPRESE